MVSEGVKKYLKFFLFLIYFIFMICILFGRESFDIYGSYYQTIYRNKNLVPFRTINQYLHEINDWYAFKNIIGNIVIFLPTGYILCYKKKSFITSMKIAAIVIIAIELIQLFSLKGMCDIDDLILNLLGVSIGYTLRFAIEKIVPLKKIQ